MIKNQNGQKPLTLSIIIPVYNEENYLRKCLDSIACQTEKPLQVIVVDNNSTDSTAAIARSYSFVTLLKESRQHQSYAQKTGFDHATGDVFARIDADTILPPDWTRNITAHFAHHKPVVALSGGAIPYDMHFTGMNIFFFGKYFAISRFFAGHKLLWGANCAFRKTAYDQVSSRLTLSQTIWEDYDLSFCLSRTGRIDIIDNIDVLASFRAVHRPLIYQLRYQMRAIRTFSLHKSRLRTFLFYLSWHSLILIYPFIIYDRFIAQPFSRMAAALGYQTSSLSTVQKRKIKAANISID